MFVVLLRLTGTKGQAGHFMEGHKAWIARGFREGVFLLVGSLHPDSGGGILAHDTSLADLERRLNEDPFVAEGVATAEILAITPAKVDERLEFLLA